MSYTHLQVKSGYSLMHSTITIPKLVKRAEELKFEALALTDEGVLYGTIPFYRACLRHGIKPIIGMTVRVLDNKDNIHPCVLLAKNNTGYHTLVKLSTYIQLHEKQAVAFEKLKAYSEGLICILPVKGQMATDFRNKSLDEINTYLESWIAMFANRDFYLGVQASELETERELHHTVKAFHHAYDVQVTASSDVIYLDEKDVIAYDCLQSMKQGKQWNMELSDPLLKNRHLLSEMELTHGIGSYWPEVLQETEKISHKCTVTFDFEQRLLPSFPVPGEMPAYEYLEKICFENAVKKYGVLTDVIKNRLIYELKIIQSMKFSDYFLIVADFIGFAKSKNILVGPGRGSSAGSIVAYVLGITEVDPLKYNLLFERFLNPERQTMPDIDVDFSDVRRDEVIDYVRSKYGEDHVAQIITFGTFAARSLIRELIKTLNIDQQDAKFILKEIPLQSRKSIAEIVNEAEELNRYVKTSPKLKALFAIAIKLEGLPRHISTHAAGVVISERPLIEHVPLTTGAADTHLTQFPMNDLEAIGLLKMDFLGLRNLTLLERVIQSINYTGGKTISLENIPDDDWETYELLRNGETNGVFQLESQGMKDVLTRLAPTSFEDIVAVNALYRPGPMEFIPVYIARKHKEEQVSYPHPDLQPILEKTFGVLVYQEQIMQIAHSIAGFTLGEADILRRAVSKKKQDVMDAQKQAFLNGCLKKGYNHKVANEIFSWIVKFSNYGFPRSHAVAYSKISYQLAYLKAHYPANFFAELLSSTRNQQDKLHLYIQELKGTNIKVLAPNINRSIGKYTVERGNIRMGLSSIKGVGNQAIGEIIQVRKDGPFKNLFDFCLRISSKLVNRATLENLIMAGAFDETYTNRASLLASIDQAIEQGELFREFSGQPNLFQNQIELEAGYVSIEDFSQLKKLSDEKELLSMYISSHPLKEHRKQLRANGYISLQQASSLIGRRDIRTAAVIQAIRIIRTKRGERMAFLTIGDEQTELDAVVFPDLFRETNRFLEEEMVIMISGKAESRNNKVQFVIEQLGPFEEAKLTIKHRQRLFIKSTGHMSEDALKVIRQTASKHPGGTSIIVYDEEKKQPYQLTDEYAVTPDKNCLRELNHYFGNENVVLQKVDR